MHSSNALTEILKWIYNIISHYSIDRSTFNPYPLFEIINTRISSKEQLCFQIHSKKIWGVWIRGSNRLYNMITVSHISIGKYFHNGVLVVIWRFCSLERGYEVKAKEVEIHCGIEVSIKNMWSCYSIFCKNPFIHTSFPDFVYYFVHATFFSNTDRFVCTNDCGEKMSFIKINNIIHEMWILI